MYAFYVTKGHTLDSLLNLNSLEKMFYAASMEYAIEIEQEKYKALLGN